MKIKKLINEIFTLDIAKSKQAAEVQKSLNNLSKITSSNPILKDLNGDIGLVNSNFAALLAQVQQQQAAAIEEQKKRDLEEKAKMQSQNKTGIGSTVPITPTPNSNGQTPPRTP